MGSYGTNASFELARTVLKTQMDALAAALTSGAITPRFASVYRTHWEQPAPALPALTIGFATVVDSELTTNRWEYLYNVELRVHTNYPCNYFDEALFFELANSVMNWLHTHDVAPIGFGSNFHRKDEIAARITPNITFDETRTVGGLITFTMFGIEEYVPV